MSKAKTDYENEQAEIIRSLSLAFNQAKEFRKPVEKEWAKEDKIYFGEDHKIGMRPRGRANPKTNLVYAQIETIKSVLTASGPRPSFKSVLDGPEWDAITEIIQESVRRVLDRNGIRQMLADMADQGLRRGKSWFKSIWNPDKWGGVGDIEIVVPYTDHCYLEPNQITVRSSNMFFEAREYDLLTLVRRYPNQRATLTRLFGTKLAGSSRFGTQFKDTLGKFFSRETTPSAPGAAANTTTSILFDMDGQSKEGKRPTVEVVEAWFYGHSIPSEEYSLQVMGTPQPVGSKDQGGVRVIQFAGDVILGDYTVPFSDLPYAEYRNIVIPEPYSMTEIKQVRNIQIQLDNRMRQIHDLVTLNAHPYKFYDSRSGFNPENDTNIPGSWTHIPGVLDGILIAPPPQLNPALFATIPQLHSDMEKIMGVQEVTRGTVPGRVDSGDAIEALQEAADIRLRAKSNEIERTMRHLIEHIIELVVIHYKPNVHFKADPELLETDIWKETWKPGVLSHEFFDIDVRAGVNLPRSRVGLQQLLMWCLANGVIDEEYFVDHTQLPEKETLISRMRDIYEAKREARISQEEALDAQADAAVAQSAAIVENGGQQVAEK